MGAKVEHGLGFSREEEEDKEEQLELAVSVSDKNNKIDSKVEFRERLFGKYGFR